MDLQATRRRGLTMAARPHGQTMGAAARSLRLLHVVSSPQWSGAAMQVSILAEGLTAKGHQVSLMAPSSSELSRRARAQGLSVVDLPAGLAGSARAARRALGEGAHEIVHAHDRSALRAVAWSGIGSPAVRRIPCALTVRGDVGYGASAAPGRRLAARVSQFWAASEWVWSALVRAGVDEDRISVLHSAVDLKRFSVAPPQARAMRAATRAAMGFADDDFVVGAARSLALGEGVEVLLEACRRVRTGAEPPGEARIRLLIAGDGPHRAALEQEARRLDVGDVTFFTGQRDDMPDLMAALDCYVHPAPAGDGFPTALREAMAMSVPVVATDLMGIREIVDNGKQGLVVKPGDSEELARALMRLRRDLDFAHRLGRQGSLKVQRYGVQAMVDRAEELYFRLVR